jgi:nucleotide-binding universal stress UspA family protein
MFERIVLAVDRSDNAKGAVAAAVDLARKSRGEVLVVHVHDTGLLSRDMIDLETPAEARLLMQAVLDVVGRADVTAHGELRVARTDGVAKEILIAAKSFDADAVVLGSRGLGDFAGLMLGSVAHRVIQMADCPVVVVRATAAAHDRHGEHAATAA